MWAPSLIPGADVRPLPEAGWPWALESLEIGLHRSLHVREERISARHDACRLLYVSDIHLRRGRSSRLCRQVSEAVAGSSPDVILLGGDMVDSASELDWLTGLVRELDSHASVLAIGGNHDARVGLNLVRAAVERGGGWWIHDDSAQVIHRDRAIAISGPDAASAADGDVRVLCAHNPRLWKSLEHDRYDLVLAGHLHGCQVVALEYRHHLLPGALLYPGCTLRHHRDSTWLVVSRGVSDLVPIRWRCPREVVLCHI